MPGRICIVGAGPSGAYLARLLTDRGFRTAVYEVNSRLALKPCGWGIPYSIDDFMRLPGEVIVEKIRGYEIFLDGQPIHEYCGEVLGYIVDKELLLRYLLEGIEVIHRGVDPRRLSGCWLVVDARGHAAYKGRKALALQAEARAEVERDRIKVYFFSDMVGYGWIFPANNGLVRLGVGGFMDAAFLRGRLFSLARSVGAELVSLAGSPIAAGGIASPRGSELAVGEAMGAVMPLTGEGIRPGFLSAKALSESLSGGRSFRRLLDDYGLTFNINLQLRILRYLERASPEDRRKLYRSAPAEVLKRVTAANLTKLEVASFIARWPGFFKKFLA
ncbi:MAG: NAD(P)/FAD-dependent oxidoreductase [Thermofilum sp.]|jgi:flavin-dependent dehydrogenase|nr:NAD(P)/FAD-dependent oxidoreductase [Thermofilum sp.]